MTAAALSLDLRGSDLGLTRVRPRADALASPGEYVPLVGIGTFVRRRGPDAAIVVLIAAGVVETFVRDLPASKAALLALALCSTTPLLLHRRFPLAAPCVVPLSFAAFSFFVGAAMQKIGYGLFAAILFAFLIGAENERGKALFGLAAGVAADEIVTLNFPDHQTLTGVLFTAVLIGAPWAGGRALRSWEQRTQALEARNAWLERERERKASEAVAAERTRIARELHDVLAHSIGVMTIQAGAARLMLDEHPESAEEPLLAVEETGRQTLGEMRRMLGVLRSDMLEEGLEPRPSLERLDALVDDVAEAGLPVELHVEGKLGHVAPGVDLAAYRIVQEALTNALRHAGSVPTKVLVSYTPGELRVEVRNGPGRGLRAAGSGHGLVGMRERATLYGGSFEAGPAFDGGFAVRATLPLAQAVEA